VLAYENTTDVTHGSTTHRHPKSRGEAAVSHCKTVTIGGRFFGEIPFLRELGG
jgi:hypothetical protein